MTTSLDIKTNPLDEFNGLEISVTQGVQTVFHASRYNDAKYAVVQWSVDPSQTKDQYLNHLIQFYHTLESGNLKSRGKRGLPIGILLDISNDTIPIDQLDGNPPKITTHSRYQDFAMLRIDSPYGVLSMEDFSMPKGWTPKTGLLCVTTHQDISTLLAPLIYETARTKADTNEIQEILLRDVYTFKK